MATEKDLELLDNYLSNNLDGPAREAFEKSLEADPALKSEYSVQQKVIEGIREARKAELKSMLSQVVIPPSSTALATKVSAWIIALGIVGFGLYYFWPNEGNTVTPIVEDTTQDITIEDEPVVITAVPQEQNVQHSIDERASKNEAQIKEELTATDNTIKKENVVKSPGKQPNPNPFNPDDDEPSTVKTEKPDVTKGLSSPITASREIPETEINSTDKKLKFHYQFESGKLILYGSFKNDLYEILEFFENDKLFLYYDNHYYLLDKTKAKPTPLKEITDATLIKKLDGFRKK